MGKDALTTRVNAMLNQTWNAVDKKYAAERKDAATANTDAQGKANKSTVEDNTPTVKASVSEILEPSLPKLKPPRNLDEARARLMKGHREIIDLAGQAGRRFYEQGMVCSYVKDKIGHGNFTNWIEENVGYHPRTVRRYMKYFEQCNLAGKLLLYKTDRTKTDTLSLLPPAETDSEETPRPKHQPGDSPEWNASDCAKALMKRFETLTARRTTDERWEVLEGFHDLARDFINSREKDREVIRGEKG